MKNRKKLTFRLLATGLAVVATGVVLWAALSLPGWLSHRLTEFAARESRQKYRLEVGRVQLHPFTNSVTFSAVRLAPRALPADSGHHSGDMLVSFVSPEIRVKGFSLFSWLFHRKLMVDNLKIARPELSFAGYNPFQQDSVAPVQFILRQMSPAFRQKLAEISIDEIHFTDASYQFYTLLGDTSHLSKARSISLAVKKFHTRLADWKKGEPLFSTDDVLLQMAGFETLMSDSVHLSQIDSLLFSLKKGEVKAFHFRLFPQFKPPQKSWYEVDVPELYLQSPNRSAFRKTDTLVISFLRFDHPKIRFTPRQSPEKPDWEDLQNFNLYDLVKNSFTQIRIDTFQLEHASLDIFQRPDTSHYQQRFNDIRVRLHNFRLDSLSNRNPEKVLHADGFEMAVAGYHLHLNDQVHDFRADSLFASTFRQSVGVKNIRIVPLSGAIRPVLADIRCRAALISGIDFREVYHNRKLPALRVEIDQPEVNLSISETPKNLKRKQEETLLFDLVSAYLRGVYAQTVDIGGGKLYLKTLRDHHETGFFKTGFHFSLADFSLDSTSLNHTDRFFYATRFDLFFSDYQMRLADDLHQLYVKKMAISSSRQQVRLDSLAVEPVTAAPDDSLLRSLGKSELYALQIPAVILWNTNLHEAYFNKKLEIKKIEVSNPVIHFENFTALKKNADTTRISDIYDLVLNYMEEIRVGELEVADGNITWTNHSRKGKTITLDNRFSARLSNFQLNETALAEKRLLFSERFNLIIRDHLFRLSDKVHLLKAGEVELSTDDASIRVRNALLYPDRSSPEYPRLRSSLRVEIPLLELAGVDFQQALEEQKIDVGRLNLQAPKVEIFSNRKSTKVLDLKKFALPLPDFIRTLKIGQLSLSDGKVITYQSDGAEYLRNGSFNLSCDVRKLDYGSQRDDFPTVAGSTIELTNLLLNLQNGQHQLSVRALKYDKKSRSVVGREVQVQPMPSAPSGTRYHIAVPRIELPGFAAGPALDNNNYLFDRILLQNPQVKLEFPKDKKGQTTPKLRSINLYPYLDPYLNSIRVGELTLSDAGLQITGRRKPLEQKNIQLTFRDICIAADQPPQNLLHSREFWIKTYALSHLSADNHYRFTADTLSFFSRDNALRLKNLKVTPLPALLGYSEKTGLQTDVAKGNLQQLVLENFDEERWLSDGTVAARRLLLDNLQLEILRDKRYRFDPGQQPALPQQLLKESQTPFVFDSVVATPALIRYSELSEQSSQPGYLDFLDLTIRAGKISNLPAWLSTNPTFTIAASARLMGEAPLQAEFRFFPGRSDFFHQITGSIAPTNLTIFNPILENTALVSLENGALNRFDFDLEFTGEEASGELFFGYENLKVNILTQKSDGLKKAPVASFLANSMLLNSKNPRGKNFEAQPISHPRDPRRSILNYWWKALFSGAKQVLGIKEEKTKKQP